MNKFRLIIFVMIAVLLLNGCATDLRNINRTYRFDSSNHKGIVFGKTSFEIPGALQYRLRFINLESKKQGEIVAARFRDVMEGNFLEKNFVVELPAGDYQIIRIQTGEVSMFGMYVSNIDTKISFSVVPGTTLYLGTLNYGYKPEHNYFVIKTGKSYLWISDDQEEAIGHLQEQYPNLADNVKVDLMQLQEKEKATTKAKF
ncbi:hypothetical protein KKC59_04265 [bacterium]|nr:hypothetical protein [bacterium]